MSEYRKMMRSSMVKLKDVADHANVSLMHNKGVFLEEEGTI